MPKTHKTILVKDKSINEVMDISKENLRSNGFRINDHNNELICTRGLGLLTAQQRFVLKFSQQDNKTVKIEGEFYIIVFYFMTSTVDEKAIAGGIPRRKGYKLMKEYISSIDGSVV